MNICIFFKYKVKCKGEYSYINECGDFSKGKIDWVKEFDGFEFVDFLVKTLKDRDFCEMRMLTNSLYISYFDPNSGETSDFTITYEEIEEINNIK